MIYRQLPPPPRARLLIPWVPTRPSGIIHNLAAVIAGASTISASVAVTRSLAAAIAGVSTVAAALQRVAALVAVIAGVSTITASLQRVAALAATIAGQSTITVFELVISRGARQILLVGRRLRNLVMKGHRR